MSTVAGRWRALDEETRQAVQTFVSTLFLTPVFLLLLVTWSDPPTALPMFVAGWLGAFSGLAWFLWSDGRDFSHVSTGRALAVVVFLVVSATFVTLVLPDGSTPALIVGVLGFNWTLSLGGLFRHVV